MTQTEGQFEEIAMFPNGSASFILMYRIRIPHNKDNIHTLL